MVMKILQALELETKNVQEAGWIVVSVRYRVGRRLGGLWYLSGTGLAGGWVDCCICQVQGRLVGGWVDFGICQVQGWWEAGWTVLNSKYSTGLVGG